MTTIVCIENIGPRDLLPKRTSWGPDHFVVQVSSGHEAINAIRHHAVQVDAVVIAVGHGGEPSASATAVEITASVKLPVLFQFSASDHVDTSLLLAAASHGFIDTQSPASIQRAALVTAQRLFQAEQAHRHTGSAQELHTRNTSEEALRAQEFWLRECQRIGRIGSYDLDIEADTWSSSEVLDDIFGIAPDCVKSVPLWNTFIHPEQQDEMLKYFINVVIGQRKPFDKEYRIIRQCDNQERWVWGRGELEFNEQGAPKRMIGTIQDITERRAMEDALKKRLVALTAPLENTTELKFDDLFDVESIQNIQDAFAEATGVASIITDPQGRPITRPSNFCRLCADIIRPTEKGNANCCHSDAVLGQMNPDGPIIKTCLSGGLKDGGASIHVGDHHIANWLIGQIRDESVDDEKFIAYAREIGADEGEFMTALASVTVMAPEKFEKICTALHLIAGQLSDLALQNIQQAKFITERKHAEAALRHNERILREAQEVAHIGYFVINPETRRWESSPVLNEIFGIDDTFEHDLDHWVELIVPQYRALVSEKFNETVREKIRFDLDYQIVRPSDGAVRWVSGLGELEYDEDGVPFQLIGTIQDITERKRLEQQLLQSQKLEGIGTLAGGIAHDFNNLLAMILGSAELLSLHTSDQPALNKYVERIIEASERGTSISRQLLVFSRPDQAELKPISVSRTIADLRDMLRHFLPRSITIETSVMTERHMIMGDAGQIHQALLNLALNASDAMSHTGTLTIKEFAVSRDSIEKRFSIDHAQQFIGISVTDTGIGMDDVTRQRIFDPFFTTKEPGKGTGLGLGIVHGIVKHHKGLIDVESSPGHGACFTLYFPVIPYAEDTIAPVVAMHTMAHRGTILVVDDEALLRETLQECFTDAGYDVVTAENGGEALKLYERNRETIDIVITDLGMPEMGGEELYQELRRIDENVKVVVSSGYLDGTSKERLLESGIKHVLTKPFKLADIRQVIQTHLEGSLKSSDVVH